MVGVTQMLEKYPAMEKVFVVLMRTMLIYAEKCQDMEQSIDPVELYEYLSEYF